MKFVLLSIFLSSIVYAGQIKIGVVDSGVEQSHPMIESKIEIIDEQSQVLTKNQQSIEDMDGHGTHVIGIIVQGLKKTSVKIVPFKNIDGSYSEETKKNIKDNMGVPEIIEFAIKHKIKVLNFSQTYPFFQEEVFQALKKANDHGILIVAAAGNQKINLSTLEKVYLARGKNPDLVDSRPQANSFPCAYKLENIICVGNYEKVGKKIIRVPESNFGKTMIDVMSYGQEVSSSCLNHGRCKMSGSSMSAPRVTVEAVKIWKKNPKLNPVEVKQALIKKLPKDNRLLGLTKDGSFLD